MFAAPKFSCNRAPIRTVRRYSNINQVVSSLSTREAAPPKRIRGEGGMNDDDGKNIEDKKSMGLGHSP